MTGDTGNLKDRTSDPTSLPPILARPSPLVAFLHLSHPTEVDPTPIVGILDKRSVSARSSPWAGHIPDLRTAVHLTAQVPVCQRRDGRSTPARLNRTLVPRFEPWAGAPTNPYANRAPLVTGPTIRLAAQPGDRLDDARKLRVALAGRPYRARPSPGKTRPAVPSDRRPLPHAILPSG